LWHGAGWNFVLWGMIQGVAIVFALGWRKYLGSPPRLVGWMATIIPFLLTGVIFRSATFDTAWRIFAAFATLPGADQIARSGPLAMAALCAIALPSSRQLADRLNERPRALVAAILGLAGAAILVQLGDEQSYEFIYFQF
jgi:hypothetical protein